MNYTEYLESLTQPIYEADGLPKCPPGYKYSPKQKQCVPKTSKDDIRPNKGGSKDSSPENAASYRIWGKTGINGDGYAWAEPNNWDGAGGGSGPEASPY